MIKSITLLKMGTKVYYQPKYYGDNKWENGIVKEVLIHTNEEVRVVYNCAGNWDKYKDYTSALTKLEDLFMGWKQIC